MLAPRSRIHVLGACGTAMATFAAMLKERGHLVRGSDQDAHPPMSELLAEKGIELLRPYAAANLDGEPPDLVVVGNAIPRGNPEMEAVLDRGLRYRSFPELLREEFLEGRHPVVVAGTHGKTTTTALTGLALLGAGLDPSILAGGYVRDLGGSHRLGEGAAFVVEGDEYDSAFFDKSPKFLKYFPRTLVINNLEYDHADIYDSLEAIKLQFRRLVHLVPGTGRVLVGDAYPDALNVVSASFAPVERFGLEESSEWRAVELEDSPAGASFTVLRRGEELGRAALPLSGEHSVRNALAALAVTVGLGGDFGRAAERLAALQGIRRRLELRGERRGVLVYDDFAHHPTAVRETIKAARSRHPGARVWALFEPRSWTSRRNVHQEAFGEAFATADRVVLAPVFQPERLDPSIRFEPEAVVAMVAAAGGRAAVLPDAEAIAAHVAAEARKGDIVLVMSNGSFDDLHDKLLARLGD